MIVSFFVFGVLSFAAFRITRFFIYDSLIGTDMGDGITKPPVSNWAIALDKWAYDEYGRDRSWFRGKVGDLLTCPWCLGFHVSWIIVCLHLLTWPWSLGIDGWLLAFGVAGVSGVVMKYEQSETPEPVQLVENKK